MSILDPPFGVLEALSDGKVGTFEVLLGFLSLSLCLAEGSGVAIVSSNVFLFPFEGMDFFVSEELRPGLWESARFPSIVFLSFSFSNGLLFNFLSGTFSLIGREAETESDFGFLSLDWESFASLLFLSLLHLSLSDLGA